MWAPRSTASGSYPRRRATASLRACPGSIATLTRPSARPSKKWRSRARIARVIRPRPCARSRSQYPTSVEPPGPCRSCSHIAPSTAPPIAEVGVPAAPGAEALEALPHLALGLRRPGALRPAERRRQVRVLRREALGQLRHVVALPQPQRQAVAQAQREGVGRRRVRGTGARRTRPSRQRLLVQRRVAAGDVVLELRARCRRAGRWRRSGRGRAPASGARAPRA